MEWRACGFKAQKHMTRCVRAGAQTAISPVAFAAVQQGLGAIYFGGTVTGKPTPTVASDPKGCLPAAVQGTAAMDQVRRQLRCVPARLGHALPLSLANPFAATVTATATVWTV
jgi:hypothetical protein